LGERAYDRNPDSGTVHGRWHTTDKLEMPGNISIIALPARCPELNPVDNIWQFMRDNWLSNHVLRQRRRPLRDANGSIGLISAGWYWAGIGERD
jgi:hypothetical protein